MNRLTLSAALVLLLSLSATARAQSDRAIGISVTIDDGEVIELYGESYALVVGNGAYDAGFDPLPGALRDVKEVAAALESRGFQVTLATDLTKAEFDRAFSEFSIRQGRNPTSRLLFYYAGHGYTQELANGEYLGYLVMVDTPAPESDPVGFDLKSVDMVSLVNQAKKIRANHVLFMFDSCFSGTILNTRDRVVPRAISDNVRHPVRQFITAGRAGESVPDYSVFKQSFLNILRGSSPSRFPTAT